MGTVAKTPDPTHSASEPPGSSRRPPSHETATSPSAAEPTEKDRITARDGRTLALREIYAGDVLALQRGFARLSPDEVRMRFLHPLTELPHDFAVRLCDLDPTISVAFVFIDLPDEPEREIRGVARAYVDPTTLSAEFAIVVQRQYTGQGLGMRLMRCLIDAVRRLGAEEIWGDVFIDNTPMLHLLAKLGFARGHMPHDPGVQRMVLTL